MKAGLKMVLGIVVGVVVLGLIASLIFWRSDYMQRWRERHFRALWEDTIKDAQRRQVLLLCKTDHQILLRAGREILSQVPENYLDTEGRRVTGNLPVPKGVRIPQAIQDISPHAVLLNYDGYLNIAMHGGMDHFGVKIYPADFREPRPNFRYGDRELLPGLWYYDDGYLHNPEYDKRIDTLIEEHKGK